MSVLVDTSFLHALKNLDDEDHDRAVELFRELLHHEHGTPYTTNLVFAEAVTVALVRTGRHSAAVSVGEMILREHRGKPFFSLHHVSPTQLSAAWKEFCRHRDQALSLTDWASVVVASDLDIDFILTFDRGFDGIHSRLC
jgi:predicted nucleic acid-binding protein